ncbi:MAG: hypothetical protein KY468_02515 [Armatimonadetes bacterium]|nr:hypothetical protein [Armatimonadota bacterium]
MDWTEIVNYEGIEVLMSAFGGFHDACIREAHLWTGHYVDDDMSMTVEPWVCARMLLQRQWRNPSAIELLFIGVHDFRMSPPPHNFDASIDEANLVLENGFFCWEDDCYYPERESSTTHITSKRLFWREADEWMGNTLRYRPEQEAFLPLMSLMDG